MTKCETLAQQCKERFGESLTDCTLAQGEVTIEVNAAQIKTISKTLRDDSPFNFDVLIDVCGVDYLHYGVSEWATQTATIEGFSRGVEQKGERERCLEWNKPRFAVVYHLLSTKNNQRLRVRAFPENDPPCIDSVNDIWNAASWFEREAFDLYGILFDGHPDLRRILTDYGFIGHPFRKDFPVSGHVEMRYDATQKRVIYQPVTIEPRTLVPKVFRDDNRYRIKDTQNA